MRIGTMLSMPGDPVGSAGVVERAIAAEEAGFDSAWLTQGMSFDSLMTLALAGRETSRIELGTSVVPTYPRHPTVMAQQALTAQEATGNRLALGMGLSHKFFIEKNLGLDYSQPIPHIRDYLTILNGLLAGEHVKHEGEAYQVDAQVPLAGTTKPPVLVAALGPAMLRVCGQLADGTVTWMGGIDFLRDFAVPRMSEAAAKAGRPAPRIVAMVPVLLADDAEEGRAAINKGFRGYESLPSYKAALERGGATLPADVAVYGPQSALEDGLQAFADAGVTEFVAVVPSRAPSAQDTTALLGELASARASSSAGQ